MSPIQFKPAYPWRGVLLVSALLMLLVLTGCTSQPVNEPPRITLLPSGPATASSMPVSTSSPVPTATLTNTPTLAPTGTPSPTATATPAILIGAGDIAVCGEDRDEQTAALLALYPGAAIFTAGDNIYDEGRMVEYRNCFGPSWGQYLDRIHPVPGNHDYGQPGASPYYEYFGAAAGEPGKGYYSYDLGDWHIVALNSICGEVGGCGIDSPQEQWLRADLEDFQQRAASDPPCILAYIHYPRWSSGLAGGRGTISGLYRALVDYGVEVLVSGDDHDYERFAPQDGDGQPDPNGVRQFVAGTGGALQRVFGTPQPNSEVRQTGTYGVLRFELYTGHYTWEFLPVDGQAFSDAGSADCH